jgi:hypothetical protein
VACGGKSVRNLPARTPPLAHQGDANPGDHRDQDD